MMMVPKGFRFNPTDEELIQILESKVSGQQMPLHFSFIVERNLYELEPQHLQCKYCSSLFSFFSYCNYYVLCSYLLYNLMITSSLKKWDFTLYARFPTIQLYIDILHLY